MRRHITLAFCNIILAMIGFMSVNSYWWGFDYCFDKFLWFLFICWSAAALSLRRAFLIFADICCTPHYARHIWLTLICSIIFGSHIAIRFDFYAADECHIHWLHMPFTIISLWAIFLIGLLQYIYNSHFYRFLYSVYITPSIYFYVPTSLAQQADFALKCFTASAFADDFARATICL